MRLRTKKWCNHYRGMHEKQECEAGVSFATLPHYGTREFMDACPCFGPCGGCDKAEYPTDEQIKENERLMAIRFENINKARATIVAHCGGPWKLGMAGNSGVIDCPACNGVKRLRFVRSGYNGHIHAACTTEGCVQWME